MNESPREFYTRLSDDELAAGLAAIKEEAVLLRQQIWYFEDELRDRFTARGASVILAGEYKVKASTKREMTWDQGLLGGCAMIAGSEGLKEEFAAAFPRKYDCSVRGLNYILKLGGPLAKAIEAARVEVKEKLEIKVEKA